MIGAGVRLTLSAAALSLAVSVSIAAPAGAAPPAAAAPGYAIVTSEGAVGTFGGAGFDGDLATERPSSPVVGMAATADQRGYWLVERDGVVRPFGDAAVGAGANAASARPTVGIALDPASGGFYTATDSGAIRAVDAAPLASVTLPAGAGPVVGVAATGRGVWLATANGGVFSSGPVAPVAAPAPAHEVVGIAATPDGLGYWLITASGRLVADGDARGFRGAPVAPSPAVAFIPSADGRGGLVLRSNGSLVAVGTATGDGDATSPLHPPLYPRSYQLPPTGAVGGAYLSTGPQAASSGPWRVTFLGDSLSVITGRYTRQYVESHGLGGWVADGGILGCGVVGTLPLGDYSNQRLLRATLPACGQWQQQYRRTLALSHPDAVVLLLGFWESQLHGLPHDGVVTVTSSEAYRRYLLGQLATVRRLVAASGARLIVLSAPYYGDGTPKANAVAFNALLSSAFPGAERVDLTTLLDPKGAYAAEVDGVRVRTSDRVHVTAAGVRRVVDPVLVPVMARAARTVRSSTAGPRNS